MKLLLKIKEEKNYQTSMFVPKRSVLHKHVSFEISRILISHSKPFTDGSIIHECLIKTMEILYPKNVPEVKKISLSKQTITRNVEKISNYLYITLKDNLKSLKYFSIAIDETNDIKDVPQVSFFLKGITNEFKMIHESLGLVPLEETTKGRDLFVSLKNILEKYDLPWKNSLV